MRCRSQVSTQVHCANDACRSHQSWVMCIMQHPSQLADDEREELAPALRSAPVHAKLLTCTLGLPGDCLPVPLVAKGVLPKVHLLLPLGQAVRVCLVLKHSWPLRSCGGGGGRVRTTADECGGRQHVKPSSVMPRCGSRRLPVSPTDLRHLPRESHLWCLCPGPRQSW